MFDLFIKIINVIAPVFILIVIGAGFMHLKWLDNASNEKLKGLLYKFLMPVMLFYFMIKVDSEIIDFDFVVLLLVYTFVIFGLAVLLAHKFFAKNNKEVGISSLIVTFSNSTYLGLPFCYLAFGVEGMAPAIITTTIYSLIFIAGSILLLQIDEASKQQANKLKLLGAVILNTVKVPLVYATFLGLVVSFIGISLPQFVSTSLEMISNVNIGLALIVIGSSLYGVFSSEEPGIDKDFWLEISYFNFYKLILSPVVAFLIIAPFEFDIIWKSVFILQASLPVGLMSYVIASMNGVYDRRAGVAILSSTLLSIITLTVILGLLFSWTV
ncbi:MAG: AEC family transporter [Alphaproteobacteria bacterium]